jgi:phosphatidylglycerophosphatase A
MVDFTHPKSVFKNPIHFLAFGFGIGGMPKAPDTYGTLLIIPFYLLIIQLPMLYYPAILLLVIASGLYICGKTAKDLGVKDHPGIVWDEFAGFLLTMLFVPYEWYWLLLGFVLYRGFDILQPYPISLLKEKTGTGLSIMSDDLVAGFLSFLVLHAVIFVVAN